MLMSGNLLTVTFGSGLKILYLRNVKILVEFLVQRAVAESFSGCHC